MELGFFFSSVTDPQASAAHAGLLQACPLPSFIVPCFSGAWIAGGCVCFLSRSSNSEEDDSLTSSAVKKDFASGNVSFL